MKEKLEKVYELTIQLQELLADSVSPKDRDNTIDKLNQLIDERGQWMEKLSPPYTDEEKKLGEKIYELNLGVQEKMQLLFQEIKQEMAQVKRQKKTQQSYANPYKDLSTSDGTFLDRKN